LIHRLKIRPLSDGPPGVHKVEYEVKDALLVLHLSQGGGGKVSPPGEVPAVPWLNLELLGCSPASYLTSSKGGLLLTDEEMTLAKLNKYVQVKDSLSPASVVLCTVLRIRIREDPSFFIRIRNSCSGLGSGSGSKSVVLINN
jgi:hypothetical protein